MKTLLVDVSAYDQKEDFLSLKAELESCGIKVIPDGNISDEKDLLVITDKKQSAERARCAGIACIGYEEPQSGRPFYGTNLVIQGFEGIDVSFLNRAYERCHGLPWMIAVTPSLIIRESVMADFEALYGLYQEPVITRFMPGMERGMQEEKVRLENYIKHQYSFYGYGLWSVIERAGGRLVGRAGLENKCGEGELGYMIGVSDQRKGYASEAVTAICAYAFKELGFARLRACIKVGNTASVRLIEKMRFSEQVEGEPGIRIFVKPSNYG